MTKQQGTLYFINATVSHRRSMKKLQEEFKDIYVLGLPHPALWVLPDGQLIAIGAMTDEVILKTLRYFEETNHPEFMKIRQRTTSHMRKYAKRGPLTFEPLMIDKHPNPTIRSLLLVMAEPNHEARRNAAKTLSDTLMQLTQQEFLLLDPRYRILLREGVSRRVVTNLKEKVEELQDGTKSDS